MADKEWYRIEGIPAPFPNLEAASARAEEIAGDSDREVEICRCTETVVRRYRRQVTVVAEDITPSA
jgi:hypothetical protein